MTETIAAHEHDRRCVDCGMTASACDTRRLLRGQPCCPRCRHPVIESGVS